MGRPRKLTPALEAALLRMIRDGVSRAGAARAAGIEWPTFESWTRRFASFSSAVTRAEGASEAALVRAIRRQAPTDWRAALALLERRFPDTWGRRDRVDIELYVRTRARELGLDPDEALAEAERVLGEGRRAAAR
jgi:transposase